MCDTARHSDKKQELAFAPCSALCAVGFHSGVCSELPMPTTKSVVRSPVTGAVLLVSSILRMGAACSSSYTAGTHNVSVAVGSATRYFSLHGKQLAIWLRFLACRSSACPSPACRPSS